MTVPSQGTKQQVIVLTGQTLGTLALSIDVIQPDNIAIYNGSLLLSSGYSIAFNVITFSPVISGPATVTVVSTEPFSRVYDFTSDTQWNSATVNEQLDRLALQAQQLRDLMGWTKNAYDNSGVVLPDIASRANKSIKFDADGNCIPTENDPDTYGNASAAAAAASAAAALDSANDSAASATASNASAVDANNSAINSQNSANAAQAWAESGTAITPGHYSAEHWAGVASYIVIPTGSINTDMLGSQVVTTAKIADNAVTTSKVGYIQLYSDLIIQPSILSISYYATVIQYSTRLVRISLEAQAQMLDSSTGWSVDIPLSALGLDSSWDTLGASLINICNYPCSKFTTMSAVGVPTVADSSGHVVLHISGTQVGPSIGLMNINLDLIKLA